MLFRFLPAFAVGIISASAVLAKDAPAWVQEVASYALPFYPGEVPAAVLLDEQHVTFDASGSMSVVSRKAIKVLTREGAGQAQVVEPYMRNGRKINHLEAWLIAPNGFTKNYEKNAIEDIGFFETMELYNDLRARRIHADNAEIGSVFAYESQIQVTALFAQDEFLFQRELPSLRSRYVLTLPQGWSAKATVFNHDSISPIIDGSTYTWELKGLPFLKHEEYGPRADSVGPRLAVSFVPPPGTPVPNCFQSWTDVSRWQAKLISGQDEVTSDISAKVQQLTANLHSDLDKIRAISRYVQGLKYVAIEMNLARGGGYRPHAAEVVLRKEYGDCKDKANLMRTMLKAAGIESYLIALSYSDRTFVREEWPSPTQFNHMIIGIHVPADVSLPAVISAPQIGPLLIFDATSQATPLGDLPEPEQGSLALLCAGDRGGLVRLPAFPAEANLAETTLDASLSPEGDLTADLTSTMHGIFADVERNIELHDTPDQYRNHLQERLSRSIRNLSLTKIGKDDSFADNLLHLKLQFASPHFGQVMQGRLLVFTPSIGLTGIRTLPATTERRSPVLLHADLRRKHVRVKLPAGFTVDEIPEPYRFDSAFAHFSVQYTRHSDELDVDEELRTEAVTVPSSEYRKAKEFFDKCVGADQQRAVLVKD